MSFSTASGQFIVLTIYIFVSCHGLLDGLAGEKQPPPSASCISSFQPINVEFVKQNNVNGNIVATHNLAHWISRYLCLESITPFAV